MAIIELKALDHVYLPSSPYEQQALKNISLSLDEGEFLGIFGPNGSGKSTLAQHLNGLLFPTRGKAKVCGLDTSQKSLRRELWKKVSLVFQYPEQQIFQVTVYDEIAYGPRNLGISEAEIKERITSSLHMVGLKPEETLHLTPFNLSGGVRRRIAIAGILAMKPELLVLDEPMAGLDPPGKKFVIDIINNRRENHETTVMISHNLQEIITLADKIAILDQGELVFYGEAKQLLGNKELLRKYNLELPHYMQVAEALAAKGLKIQAPISSIDEAGREILKLLA